MTRELERSSSAPGVFTRDLVQKPESSLRAVRDTIALPYSAAMLDHSGRAADLTA